jgi:DNA-binding response OmpR family regulator
MLKVMIAEDDPMMADLLEEVLVDTGYEVCGIASTVEEGIELGKQHKPDLAIVDMRLADGGIGMDIAAGLNRRSSLGVLYTSGNSGQMGLTQADGACIAKPYRAADVVRALEIVEQMVRTGEASRPF